MLIIPERGVYEKIYLSFTVTISGYFFFMPKKTTGENPVPTAEPNSVSVSAATPAQRQIPAHREKNNGKWL
jgi:hypothetical protein